MKKEFSDLVIFSELALVSLTIGTYLLAEIMDKTIKGIGDYYTKIIRNREQSKE